MQETHVLEPRGASLGRAPATLVPVAPALRRRSHAARLLEGSGWTALRLATDGAMLLAAVALARIGAPAAALDEATGLLLALFVPLALVCLSLRGMYETALQDRWLDAVGRLLGATSLAAMGVVVLQALVLGDQGATGLVAREWLLASALLALGRLALSLTQRRARVRGVVARRTLIVGAGAVGAQVERRLEAQPELGLRLVGYVDDNPPSTDLVPERTAPVLGRPSDLPAIVAATGAEHVIFAFQSNRGADARLFPIVRMCDALGLEASLVPRLFESINVRVGLEHIGGMPLFRLRSISPVGWQFRVKHAIDRLAAAVFLVPLAPLLLGLAAAVRVSSPGPVFFRQRRIGRDGQAFDILKFRSMRITPAVPAAGTLGRARLAKDQGPGGVEGDDRRTRVGTFLRRSSLDELPQLINVLRGEMSLVGPRPERPEFVDLFGEEVYRYRDRHRVRSGITGWAQVHRLRGNTSLKDRVEWDNFYIENWSFWLDLKILVMTATALFHRVE